MPYNNNPRNSIGAPYNFVPLNEKVFTPWWGDIVNHDVPFENGLSGKISLKITAESPLFLRNTYQSNTSENYYTDHKGNQVSTESTHIIKDKQKHYFIPGSSIKGEIASVLENLSFGRLTQFDNDHYSVRDMTNSELVGKATHGGFLKKENNTYIFFSFSKLRIIPHTNLKSKYGIEFKGIEKAEEKNIRFKEKYDKTNFFQRDTVTIKVNGKPKKKPSALINGEKDFEGTLVFTGDIESKKYEFVFEHTSKKQIINPEIIKDFLSVYNNTEYDFLLQELKAGEQIPVFASLQNNDVKAIGCTQLFKLKYKYDIAHFSQQEIASNKADLCEVLFGTEKNEAKGLKGRVQITHAFSNNAKEIDFPHDLELTLGQPQSSFYPFYIQQEVHNNGILLNSYVTYNNKNGKIAGRKRYPVVKRDLDFYKAYSAESKIRSDSATFFKPLASKSTFEGTINFQNLLPEELGAIISALSFHNHTGLRHQLGMAKPYGFGVVKIELIKLETSGEKQAPTINNCLVAFESMMQKFTQENYNQNWIETEQIHELFAIAKPMDYVKYKFCYLKLDPDNKIDEFRDVKNTPRYPKNELQKYKYGLPRYSKFMEVTQVKCSLLNENFDFSSDKEIILENKKKIETHKLALNKCLEQINTKKRIIKKRQIQEKTKRIQQNILNKGIESRIKNIDEYQNLIDSITTYKASIGFESEKILPEKDHSFVLSIMNEIHKKLKGIRKKRFPSDSKKKTLSSWVGIDKSEKWFNKIENR